MAARRISLSAAECAEARDMVKLGGGLCYYYALLCATLRAGPFLRRKGLFLPKPPTGPRFYKMETNSRPNYKPYISALIWAARPNVTPSCVNRANVRHWPLPNIRYDALGKRYSRTSEPTPPFGPAPPTARAHAVARRIDRFLVALL